MRVFIALLDGVGVGALPDAQFYGDEGSHTLRNVAQSVGGLSLPNLAQLGLGMLGDLLGVPLCISPSGLYGKMLEQSPGKDTTSGHWEIAGIILEKPFPVYPHGFPQDVVERIERAIGRRILGNKPASGTAIIEELGVEHLRTGFPIIYTSADSVLQVAAHEEVVPPAELYAMCERIRSIMTGEHAVARVIARPFRGEPGSFVRTPNRRDFSLPPPRETILDVLSQYGKKVVGIGKIWDIFAGRGIGEHVMAKGNSDVFSAFRKMTERSDVTLVWANFNDFDTLYGHRNDVQGFAQALETWDKELETFLALLRRDDVLIITSDHGCDPTTPSTDHSREYALLLVFSPRLSCGKCLGVRRTFADIAATLAELFGVDWYGPGESFAAALVS
ncbi:phosphopentomutase [Candidatus Caldatribacterium sp.]|uniref:phosphopentomutase n=1 Tax=Candidatus Caldatribacterium sp. TaxID=2282143 RepID=UPI002995260D|nr:phosphopentomutase [Candidatus Caldatribacterium sp.]MDW8080768.1 phosphopentomutase [Candidatus Calescibacterium sp.]